MEREEPTKLATHPGLGHAGPYALIDVLGTGGMGRVYLARHTTTHQLCALKRPHPDGAQDPSIRGRFEREVEIGRRVKHPGVPRLIDADLAADWPYLVLELVPGLNLEQLSTLLRRRARILPYPVSLTVVAKALEALEAAHELQVVHRDITPRNVMLSFDGSVKLIDFGVAKAEAGSFKTTPGSEMGSIRYASPESVRGAPVGHRADLYGIAAVAYELLCGRPVVPEVDNFLRAVKIIAEEEFVPIRSANPEVPGPVADVIEHALAKDPARRPASALAFREALYRAKPDWCAVDPGALQEFLGLWFPAEARALQRFWAAKSEGPLEEEVLRTVLAPTHVSAPTVVSPSPDAEALVRERIGFSFPELPPVYAGPPSKRQFGLPAIVATALGSAALAAGGVLLMVKNEPQAVPAAVEQVEAAPAAAPQAVVAQPPTQAPPASRLVAVPAPTPATSP